MVVDLGGGGAELLKKSVWSTFLQTWGAQKRKKERKRKERMEWLRNIFSRCSPNLDSHNITFEDSPNSQARSDEQTPIIALSTIELAEDEDDRTEMNTETEDIQHVLSIVEKLRQRKHITKGELMQELRQILSTFNKSEKKKRQLLCLVIVRNALSWARSECSKSRTHDASHISVSPPPPQTQFIRSHTHTHSLFSPFAQCSSLLLTYTHFVYISSCPRTQSSGDSYGILGLVFALVDVLSDEQQVELYSILSDLPSSVLGDDAARDQSRVFIDIKKDIREAQKLDLVQVERKQHLVEVVTGVIVELITTLASSTAANEKGIQTVISSKGDKQEREEREEEEDDGEQVVRRKDAKAEIIASLLDSVNKTRDGTRLVMEQLLLAKESWLPSDHGARRGVLKTIFRAKNITEH